MIYILAFALLSFIFTVAITPILIRQGEKYNIRAVDRNKRHKPLVFHIGGIAITTAFFLSSMAALALNTFHMDGVAIEINKALAIVLTGLALSFLGLVDDIIPIPQWVKALLPMFAAVPLVALRMAGSTVVGIPFIGPVDLGLFYLLVIIPLAISGSANLANILAGINGIEAGLAAVMYAVGLILGLYFGKLHLALFSAIMLGSALGFLIFNWYPAKAFPGDTATLLFGGLIAALAIVDNLEGFVPFLFIPHFIDLAIKIKNGLPSKGWWLEEKDGYLYAPKKKVGLLQHVVGKLGKIKEEKLTLLFIGIEMVIGLFVLLLYLVILRQRALSLP